MPLTPVPLTVQNLGVLLVGLLLGSRRGFAAMALYLAEGAGGTARVQSHRSGRDRAIARTDRRIPAWSTPSSLSLRDTSLSAAQRRSCAQPSPDSSQRFLLFAGGLTWLYVFTHSLAKAAYLGLYWFLAAEVIKVMLAAGIANRWRRRRSSRER